MKILGVYFGHNGSVAVLKDGKLVFCQSEERFNRLKNSVGFPKLTIDYVYKKFGKDFDCVVIPSTSMNYYMNLKKSGLESARFADLFKSDQGWKQSLSGKMFWYYFVWKSFRKGFIWFFESRKKRQERIEDNESLKQEAKSFFADLFEIDKDKVIFLDHHMAHAYSPCFLVDKSKKHLVFTLDAEGDRNCATVSEFDNGEMNRVSVVNERASIGHLWYFFSIFLGMKPLEDEYKIMGLAPYSKEKYSTEIKEEFKKIIWLNEKDEFESSFPSILSLYYFMERFYGKRFDNLAGGIQSYTEEIVCDWIRRWVIKTGIKDIVLSGGVFMNVKLNQRVAEIDEVNSVTIMPSAGDESTVIGSVYHGYKELCKKNKKNFKPVKLNNLYLGTSYSNEEIKKIIDASNLFQEFNVQYYDDIEKKVAEILANNTAVARFKGAMEFGARALGNRSILANATSYDNVRIINTMVKKRDFWMPFASSILEEDEQKYTNNPKQVIASFMSITFDTKDVTQKDLIAGIHPYDFTTRPQIVTKEINPDYHRLIYEFKNLTGIGGILNTSFNLHGEPIVESPGDAIKAFRKSGLTYLALGNYLIKKY